MAVMNRREFLGTAAIGAAAVGVAACGGSSATSTSTASQGTPRRGGTLRVAATGGSSADTCCFFKSAHGSRLRALSESVRAARHDGRRGPAKARACTGDYT